MKYKIFFLLLMFACSSNYTPKPRAYVKINLPIKEYLLFDSDEFQLNFRYPKYSDIQVAKKSNFINVNFKSFSGILHLTYVKLNNNLYEHIEDARSLAYKHNVQANSISEQVYIDSENKVFGMLYDYSGMTATSTQFYLTDSISHFLRGSFYFDTEINDSIAPVNIFIKEDVRFLVESVRWE